jgi:hypothetical protein
VFEEVETSRFGASLQDHKPTIVARSPIKALPAQAHSTPNFNRYGNIEDDIRIPAPTPVKLIDVARATLFSGANLVT